jgi:hypothetical protein
VCETENEVAHSEARAQPTRRIPVRTDFCPSVFA